MDTPSPSTGPVLPQSLPEIAHAYILDALLRGKYAPGDVLIQEDLASQLGTSRVPVREALKKLESEGLVILRPRRGYVVVSLDPDEVADIFDIRMVLEEHAAYLGAKNRDESHIREAENLLAQMDDLAAQGLPNTDDKFDELNRRFHRVIFQASGRAYLLRTIETQQNLLERYVRLGGMISRDLQRTQEDHRAIFQAFKDGDAAATARHSRQHVRNTCDRLVKELRRRKASSEK